MDWQFLRINSIKMIIKEDVHKNLPLVVLDKLRVGRFLRHKNPLFFNITVHLYHKGFNYVLCWWSIYILLWCKMLHKQDFNCWSKHCKVCVLKRGLEYAGLYLSMMHDDICLTIENPLLFFQLKVIIKKIHSDIFII